MGNQADAGDLVIDENGKNSVVWAIGRLARPGGRKSRKEPSFHHTYPKEHVEIDLTGKVPEKFQCRPFIKRPNTRMMPTKAFQRGPKSTIKTWGPHRHYDYALRTFDARLGNSTLRGCVSFV